MAALCSLQLLPEVLPKNLWALTNSATVFEGEKTWLPFKIESIQASSWSPVLTIRSLSVENAAQFPVHSDFSWVPWPLWNAASDGAISTLLQQSQGKPPFFVSLFPSYPHSFQPLSGTCSRVVILGRDAQTFT